ncbi:MAG: type II secretion system F family protein [Candidatus Nanopelagicales bacterium]|nr:type II secretion system F family protein [Candidatus Nanopelagicales bacterium]
MRTPKESYVGALVKAAGLANVTTRTVYTTMAIAGLATGSISLIITSLPIVAVMAAVGATFIPIFSLKRRARVRSKALRTSWPDAVDSLASSVRAGMSLPEAVADLSKNGPAQLRYAFTHFSDYYRSTGSFAQALNALQERLGDPVADRVISALRIAHEVGGTDLGHVLRTLSALLRSDALTRGDIEARQSWTISAARMSIAAPWLTLAMLCTRPDAVAAFRTGLGAVVLLGAAAISFIAYRLMLRIGALPLESRVVFEVPA